MATGATWTSKGVLLRVKVCRVSILMAGYPPPPLSLFSLAIGGTCCPLAFSLLRCVSFRSYVLHSRSVLVFLGALGASIR